VVAVAAGSWHNLALKADGTMIGWGWDDYGRTNIPDSATNVIAMAAGTFHNLALKADGPIVGWGGNSYGQAGVPGNVSNLNLSISVSGTANVDAPGAYILTYSATNALGAAGRTTRTVYVVDTLPPVLTLLGTNPLMHQRGLPFVDPGATATDACAGNLTGSIVTTNTVNTNVPSAYTNTYTVRDASGNAAVTNRTVLVVTRPALTGLAHLGNGAFQFSFTNTPGARFNVLATTNLALPLSEWSVLGPVAESPPGQFHFTDLTATNHPARYYRLRWP
jgi:hypothetical protein